MRPILDQVPASQRDGNPERRATSAPLECTRLRPSHPGTVRVRFQSLPPSSREQSSARAERVATPAPGLGGVFQISTALLEEADREWFIWRFGDDA
jgi:hypothetical protein